MKPDDRKKLFEALLASEEYIGRLEGKLRAAEHDGMNARNDLSVARKVHASILEQLNLKETAR